MRCAHHRAFIHRIRARPRASSSSENNDNKNARRKRKREVKVTVKDKEILRYSVPNFFPDFINDFNPEDAEETMEEIGRRSRREGKEGDLDDENEDENEEDNEKKMIYVWKKGMELEERKVVRENQEKIDALYPKMKKSEEEEDSDDSKSPRREAREILGDFARTRFEEETENEQKYAGVQSMLSKALLFATVFAYALGLVLTTHRGVVDLSSPAPIECERGEVECDEKMLPERVEVFVREER